MMAWLRRNAEVIEAAAATVTAIIAVVALVGIKMQLDAADHVQRAQSARDAFRAHLVLSVAHPDFAAPVDGCAMVASPQAPAYWAYVEHLLYAAEQMLDVAEGWESVFSGQLLPHTDYVCQTVTLSEYSPGLAAVLSQFQSDHCPAQPTCDGDTP